MQAELAKGDAFIQRSRQAESSGMVGEAYDLLCDGLGVFLQILPTLDSESARGQEMQSQVSSYLEHAEKLKERLPADQASGSAAGAAPGRSAASSDPPDSMPSPVRRGGSSPPARRGGASPRSSSRR